jgi:uroporphyrinogen decarboxylase
MALSHRDRVIKAISHQEPDRIPFDLGSTMSTSVHVDTYQKLKAHFGVDAEDKFISKMTQIVAIDEAILQALDIDLRGVIHGAPDSRPHIPVGEDGYQDEYGVVRRKPPSSKYYDQVKWPLAGSISLRDVMNFSWPDASDPGYTRGLREQLQYYRDNTDYATVLRLPAPFVMTSQFVRGFQDWYMDLAADKKLAAALFDAAVEHSMAVAEEILKVTGDLIDVVATGEDLGLQNGPIISPELYRELLKPRHMKWFNLVKKNTSAFIHLHSCGSIYKLLPDIVEMGVDIVNPVQVAAKDMDSSVLGREYGDRLTFWGGIDTQRVLPRGSTTEVRAEVKRRIRDLAPGGGYVLASVHNIQPDVPLENILAMYDAAKTYGRYPISLN